MLLMTENTMRPKQGLKLRKVGRQYMIVEACRGNADMSNVYSMNRTAALLWEQMEKGNCTPDALAECLCDNYDIDKATAIVLPSGLKAGAELLPLKLAIKRRSPDRTSCK